MWRFHFFFRGLATLLLWGAVEWLALARSRRLLRQRRYSLTDPVMPDT